MMLAWKITEWVEENGEEKEKQKGRRRRISDESLTLLGNTNGSDNDIINSTKT